MSTRTELTAAVATLVAAAASWLVAAQQMHGMDMGVETDVGSFAFFAVAWVLMMAAMMLPGAVPAVVRRARADGLRVAPLFAGSYLAVWAVVGLAVYVAYRPHGTTAAGALTIAAGLYELTPLKRHCRRRCREYVRSGVRFGLYCVGSSIGLMAMLAAVGVMSLGWMAAVAVLVLAQKLFPPRASVDVPLALALVCVGALVAT